METARYSSGHKWILRLAIPNILSNLTVPILGMFDLGMAGHLQYAEEIAAVALATTLFNLLYWNFGFLRMGTTGLTAQSHGRGDKVEMGRCLLQSGLIGVAFGLLIFIFRHPIFEFLLGFMTPDGEEVLQSFTADYFLTAVYGAPAVLLTFALNGWLIGMQNTWWPMTVAITTNLINIGVSAYLVIVEQMGIVGIATGTVVAQWIGLLMLLYGAWQFFLKRKKAKLVWSVKNLTTGLGRFFSTNIHIFLRTLLLVATNTYFTYYGTRQGPLVLAANALLMQFVNLFSYFIDGFAYAAEAIVGHLFGSRQGHRLKSHIKLIFLYGTVLSLVVSGLYLLFGQQLLAIFTDKPDVIAFANHYLKWICFIPLLSFAAYIWDGIYIGLTYTREMLITMVVAVLFYFGLIYLAPFKDPNQTLWFSFAIYLAVRGAMQTILGKGYINKIEETRR